MEMLRKHKVLCGGHPVRITIAKPCSVLNQPDTPAMHSAPYRAGTEQRKLEREEIDKM